MKRLILALALLVFPTLSQGAMTCTASYLTHYADIGAVKHGTLWTCAWTSSAGGAASADVVLNGLLARMDTVPSGASAPTDNYAVTLPCTRTASNDTLAGLALNNRDTANSEFIPTPGSGVSVIGYYNDTCTVTIAGAGNAKAGTVYLSVVNP